MYVDSVQFGDAVYTDPERVRGIIEYMTSCLTASWATHGGQPGTGRDSRDRRWPGVMAAAKLLNPLSRTVAQDIRPR